MSSADWTSISSGTGSFAIIGDATAPSPPSVMQILEGAGSGGVHFQNITAGTFKDSRVSGWSNQTTGAAPGFVLILRSLNANFSAGATYFRSTISPISATMIHITLDANVAGVITTIGSVNVTSFNGNPVGSWQQYQLSAFNSGTDILLRVAQWNGASFTPVLDSAAPIASFATLDAAGNCRFGAFLNPNNGLTVDDVNYYSLT